MFKEEAISIAEIKNVTDLLPVLRNVAVTTVCFLGGINMRLRRPTTSVSNLVRLRKKKLKAVFYRKQTVTVGTKKCVRSCYGIKLGCRSILVLIKGYAIVSVMDYTASCCNPCFWVFFSSFLRHLWLAKIN